jgi:hypothetical protein
MIGIIERRNPSGGGGGGAKTPLQSTSEEGEDLESLDKECCGLNN